MHPRWVWMRILLFAHATIALPEVAFPINSQVPPLARVGSPFSFQFSQSTFSERGNLSLSYTLQGAPAWLCLDSAARTFSGNPSASDVGPAAFTLVATDSDGSVKLQTTFIVTQEPAPQLQVNVTESLAKAGQLSDQTDLSLHTGSIFNLAFNPTPFGSPLGLTYAATSADNTPLPSWITFNSAAVTFSGVTPPPVPNPQIVGLKLIASTIAGFSAASINFNIVISDHTFAFESLDQPIQIVPGQRVDTSVLQNQLLLDGSVADPSAIAWATADTPQWLELDSRTLWLHGIAPLNIEPHDIHVKVSDIYGNNAEATINIHTEGSTTVSSSAPKGTLSASESGSPESTSIASTDATASSTEDLSAKPSRAWIAAAVLVPLALLPAMIALLICCSKRRRRRPAVVDSEARNSHQNEKFGRTRYQLWRQTQRQSKPQVQFKGAAKTLPERSRQVIESSVDDRPYAASDLGSQEELVLDSHQRSSMGGGAALMSGRPGFNPREHRSGIYTPYQCRENRFSRSSRRGSNIASDRRLTGLGHGRFSAGSSTRIQRRSSRRCNHCGSLSVTTLDRLPSTTGRSQRASRPFRSSIRHVHEEVQEADETSESSKSEADGPQQVLERIRVSDNRSHEDKRESYFRKRRASKRSVLPEEVTLSPDERRAHMEDAGKSLTRGSSRGPFQSPVNRPSDLSMAGHMLSGSRLSRSNSASGSSSNPPGISWGTKQGRRISSDTMINPFGIQGRHHVREQASGSLDSEGWDDTSGESESRYQSETGMVEGDIGREPEERLQSGGNQGIRDQLPGKPVTKLATYGSLNWRMAKKPNLLDSVAETQAGTGEAVENEVDDRSKAML